MLLVTGASGHLGDLVLKHLIHGLQIPAQKIAAASRTPAKLAAWAAQGISTRALDFEDPQTFATAFAGIERVLLISTDAIDRPGRRLSQHQAAIDAMTKAGVKHVVYTSMPNPAGSPLLIAPDHEGTEEALTQSNLQGWTILRNHWYFENIFYALPSILATGHWYTADEGKGSADIARDDLARAAATVLASSQNEKRVYTLSGGKALTKTEIAKEIGAAINKKIEVVQVPLEALVNGMVAAGLPEPVARVYASFHTNTAAGRVSEVTNDFKAITGLEPQSFSDWVSKNKNTFLG